MLLSHFKHQSIKIQENRLIFKEGDANAAKAWEFEPAEQHVAVTKDTLDDVARKRGLHLVKEPSDPEDLPFVTTPEATRIGETTSDAIHTALNEPTQVDINTATKAANLQREDTEKLQTEIRAKNGVISELRRKCDTLRKGFISRFTQKNAIQALEKQIGDESTKLQNLTASFKGQIQAERNTAITLRTNTSTFKGKSGIPHRDIQTEYATQQTNTDKLRAELKALQSGFFSFTRKSKIQDKTQELQNALAKLHELKIRNTNPPENVQSRRAA